MFLFPHQALDIDAFTIRIIIVCCLCTLLIVDLSIPHNSKAVVPFFFPSPDPYSFRVPFQEKGDPCLLPLVSTLSLFAVATLCSFS